jgi:DNA primase
MKCGITNTVAVEGTHVPKSISDLTRKRGKKVTAFLDGDRGGDLILRELMQVAKVDYIARAPEGKEVEDLSRREVTKALQTQIPADQALAIVKERRTAPAKQKKTAKKPTRITRTQREPRRHTERPERRPAPSRRPARREPIKVDEAYRAKIGDIKEAFKAVLFNEKKEVLVECGVAELAKTLEAQETVPAIVFDGVITQRLVDIATKKKTEFLIGAAVADIESKPSSMKIVTFDDLE